MDILFLNCEMRNLSVKTSKMNLFGFVILQTTNYREKS